MADGKFFVHIFTHKEFAYPFEVIDETDWMAKYFFTGGQMPSDDLFLYFQKDFLIENHWVVNGTHYARTSEAWYENMIENKDKLMPILASTYGEKEKTKIGLCIGKFSFSPVLSYGVIVTEKSGL